jgi:hypothetical protein
MLLGYHCSFVHTGEINVFTGTIKITLVFKRKNTTSNIKQIKKEQLLLHNTLAPHLPTSQIFNLLEIVQYGKCITLSSLSSFSKGISVSDTALRIVV